MRSPSNRREAWGPWVTSVGSVTVRVIPAWVRADWAWGRAAASGAELPAAWTPEPSTVTG